VVVGRAERVEFVVAASEYRNVADLICWHQSLGQRRILSIGGVAAVLRLGDFVAAVLLAGLVAGGWPAHLVGGTAVALDRIMRIQLPVRLHGVPPSL
jgi:hypothetical protein